MLMLGSIVPVEFIAPNDKGGRRSSQTEGLRRDSAPYNFPGLPSNSTMCCKRRPAPPPSRLR